jgi:GT2 family glycosyltransferase
VIALGQPHEGPVVNPPLVSVVIPCYRQAHLLPAALESVFAQTYPAVEAIVVNDGSDDNTDEVARSYLPRIRYVSQKNGGLPAARNAGIEVATGDYLLFLDSDDLLHPEAIHRLVTATAGRDDCLAVSGSRVFRHSPDEPGTVDRTPSFDQLMPSLLHDCVAPVHAFLVPRVAVNAVGRFEPTLRSSEDWDLWTRIAIRGISHVIVPEVCAFYRHNPGSMSTNQERMLITRTQVLLRAFALLSTLPDKIALWGQDLVSVAHLLRRRHLVCDIDPTLARSLGAMITSLGRLGYKPPLEGIQSKVARILGSNLTDRIAIMFYRVFDSGMIARYRGGIPAPGRR